MKLGREKSIAAAVITSTIPGISFYFDGQCDGKKIRLPVQLGREPVEKQDEKIKGFYRNLFKITKARIFRNGDWKLLDTFPVSATDNTFENILAWEWRLDNELRIIAVNFNNTTSRCRLKFDVQTKNNEIVLIDLITNLDYKRSVNEIAEKGLFVELKSFNSHIFAIID